jgi:hypothetical protein
MRQGDERNPPADTGASGWAAVPFFNYLLTKPGFALIDELTPLPLL